jgi:hypothetical protein
MTLNRPESRRLISKYDSALGFYVRRSARMLLVGIGLILSAIATDLIGSTYQLLVVLIFSLALAVAGAVIAIRGMVEFIGELL